MKANEERAYGFNNLRVQALIKCIKMVGQDHYKNDLKIVVINRRIYIN